jgi:O-antigen ligase
VLVDTVRRARPDPVTFARRLALAFLLSCTAAGAVAIIDYLADGGRAAGPLADPNDLAFFMIAALPFAWVAARRSALTTYAWAACGAVLVVATFATLSRGALLGLAVMVVVALLLGAVRLRTMLGVGAVATVVLGVLWVSHADVVGRSIQEKQHVAATNIDLRVTTVTVAAEMTADSPLLGQGPGGFEASMSRFVPVDTAGVQQTVAHQMYLDVSAELGLLGLGAFLAVLVLGTRGALRARALPDRRRLADAVLVALSGTLVSACFLSEQFFVPVWLLVALGIALDPTPGNRLGRS